jgi:hypothetical protein
MAVAINVDMTHKATSDHKRFSKLVAGSAALGWALLELKTLIDMF